MKNTITQQQANELSEKYVADAVSAFSPPARLELAAHYTDSPCDDPTDHGPRGRITASRTYWLRDVPHEQNEAYIGALITWWEANGFTVLTDARPKDVHVMARHLNGFDMSIQASMQGDLSLGASSPCVWPNGTPEPRPT